MIDDGNKSLSNMPAVSRFIVFIVCAILIAFALVVISMRLYQKSGAAQLDLSRPSYQDVRSEVKTVRIDGFDSVGPIDKKSLDKFNASFSAAAKKITDRENSFSAESLSDGALGITVE